MLKADPQAKEVPISEWLQRLNLQKYTTKFHRDGLRRVGDLRRVAEHRRDAYHRRRFDEEEDEPLDSLLWGYEMTAVTDRDRVVDMIRGRNAEGPELFAMQTRAQARSII